MDLANACDTRWRAATTAVALLATGPGTNISNSRGFPAEACGVPGATAVVLGGRKMAGTTCDVAKSEMQGRGASSVL